MPFEKGDPRINRKGRPKKGESLTHYLGKVSNQEVEIKVGDIVKTVKKKEGLALVLWQRALGGDMRAAKLILEYVDGIPKQKVEHSGYILQSIENMVEAFREIK